jgi:hypothetical protein
MILWEALMGGFRKKKCEFSRRFSATTNLTSCTPTESNLYIWTVPLKRDWGARPIQTPNPNSQAGGLPLLFVHGCLFNILATENKTNEAELYTAKQPFVLVTEWL